MAPSTAEMALAGGDRMSVIFVYMTAPSMEEAKRIGNTLVEERLAACVNLVNGMISIYRWQGKTEEGSEVIVIAKTTQDLFERMAERVCALHSYDCPCIVAMPITQGHQPFLDWVAEETA